MKSKNTQKWIPLYIDKWIFGSTRIELEPDERGVFVDLICLGAKDNGYIRANEELGYLPRQLCGILNISEELLNRTIQKCVKCGKLEDKGNGIYYLKNWEKYQFSNRTYLRLTDEETDEIVDEKKFKEKIINILETNNIKYETEKRCSSGIRIDIFVNTKKPVIIEVKGNSYSDSIRGGIRQLLEYGIEYPDSILALALPIHYRNEVSGNILNRLEELNINLITYNNLEQQILDIVRQTDISVRQTDISVRQTDTIEYNIIKDNIIKDNINNNIIAQNDCKNNPSVLKDSIEIKQTSKVFDKKQVLYGSEGEDVLFDIQLKDGTAKLCQSIIDKFKDTYIGIDVMSEIKKAITWMDTNPYRRKTTKGILRYLNSWLARANDNIKVNNSNNKLSNTLSTDKKQEWLKQLKEGK